MTAEDAAATALVHAMRRFRRDGLAVGTAGNASVRLPDGRLAITPTGVRSTRLESDHVSIVDLEGRTIRGLAPSSELALHRTLYQRRPDVAAVVHTHSLSATALAVAERELPHRR